MSNVNSKMLAELACFLEGVLDDQEIMEAGGADLTLTIEEIAWLLDQIYFTLGSSTDISDDDSETDGWNDIEDDLHDSQEN